MLRRVESVVEVALSVSQYIVAFTLDYSGHVLPTWASETKIRSMTEYEDDKSGNSSKLRSRNAKKSRE